MAAAGSHAEVVKKYQEGLRLFTKIKDVIGWRFKEFCSHFYDYLEGRTDKETFYARTSWLLFMRNDLFLAMSPIIAQIVILDRYARESFKEDLIQLCSDEPLTSQSPLQEIDGKYSDALAYCIKVREIIGPRFEEFCIHLNQHMEKRIDLYTFCARTFPLLCAHPDLLLSMPRALGPIAIQDQEIRRVFRGELIQLYSHSLPDLNIKLNSPPGNPTSTAIRDQNVHQSPSNSQDNQNTVTPSDPEADKSRRIRQELHQLLLDLEKEGGLTPPLMQKYMCISSQMDELRQPMIDQAMKILNRSQKQPVVCVSDTDSEKTNSDSDIGTNSKYSAERPNSSGQNEQESIGLKQHWEFARQEWSIKCAQWHAREYAQQQQMTNKLSEREQARNEDTTRNVHLLAVKEYVDRQFDGDREKSMPMEQKQVSELKRRDEDWNISS